ncbi:MAG TPA: hypothetical protein P5336_11690, partial [Treponema sp.]|nr:hypothetical protein [Treponema sp.]
LVQGPAGVRQRYQGVAEQPWGYGDPMVVHARTPNNDAPPEGPRQCRRPPNKFPMAPSRQSRLTLDRYGASPALCNCHTPEVWKE